MDFKKQYSFILMTLFALLLAACSSTPTPPPTTTATFSPTGTPTITPSPTETPDPNKPTGATGIEPSSGYYTKTENGAIFYWIPIQINAQDSEKGHWFRSLMKDGNTIPLLDYGDNTNEYQKNDLIPLTAYVAENALGKEALGVISHQNYPKDADYSFNFKNVLETHLAERYFKTKNPGSLTPNQWGELLNGWQDSDKSTVSFHFNTADGTYAWAPSPKTGANIYIIKWEDADPNIHSDFHESHMPLYKEIPAYRWAVHTDSNGGLVGFVATQDIKILDKSQLIVLLLSPIAEVVSNEKIPENGFNNFYFDDEVRLLVNQASEIEKITGLPYFIIEK